MNFHYKYTLFVVFFCFFSSISFAQINRKEEKIQEIVIKKGKPAFKKKKENPAFAIMQEVWKRKKNNGLEKYKTYQYKEYEKIEFDLNNLDSTFTNKKIFNKLDFIFDYADSTANKKISIPFYFTEAQYENFGQNDPKKFKRNLIAQKTSGFDDNEIITQTAQNVYRDINIYDNTINYFDIGFQSPVSKDGFSTYHYEVTDTISINGQQAYKIRYEPKRKDVLAFQGFLYISTENFAVMQATLRSSKKMNINFVNGIFTELEFDNPDEETFLPKKTKTVVEMTLLSKKKSAKSIVGTRTVYYSNYQFNQPLDEKVFDTTKDDFKENKLVKDDQFWENIRVDSLSKTEKGIYEMIDRLENTPKFRKMVKLYETLASGYYNIGNAIDIGSLYSIYGINEIEGNRIRLGARTFFSKNDDWRIQGYGAYGFKDKRWKYGLEAKYMFNKINRFTLGVGRRNDILQLGVQLTTDDGIMSRSFASSTVFVRGENLSLSNVTQNNFFAAIDPWKNFTIRLDASQQTIESANNRLFNLNYWKNNQWQSTLKDTHLTMSLVARPGAKFSQNGVDRYEHSSLAPTIILKYTRGFDNILDADFSYNKLQFMFYKPMLISCWGRMIVNLEAGKTFEAVPLALQNIIPGNQSYSVVPNTFSQLNFYEFVADQYATLHLEHHFNGKIFSYIPLLKKLKLREVAFIRSAYGTLSQSAKNLNQENYKYTAPNQRIYYEFGVGIENIGFGNLRFFRIDFNWRGNYLHQPNASKFGIKAGVQFYY